MRAKKKLRKFLFYTRTRRATAGKGAKYGYDRTLRWLARRLRKTRRQAAVITVHDSGSSSVEGTFETSSPENIWSDASNSPTPDAIDKVLRYGTLRRARVAQAAQRAAERRKHYKDNYIRSKCDKCEQEGAIYLGHGRSGCSTWEAVIGLCLECGGKPTKWSHLHAVERSDLMDSDSGTE